MQCINCGSPMGEGEKFCGKCGAGVPVQPSQPATFVPSQPAPLQKASGSPKWLKILGLGCLGFLVLIGLIVAVVFYSTSGIGSQAEDVLEQLRQGKWEEVYRDSHFNGTATSLAQFKTLLGAGGPLDISKAERIGWTGRGFKNNEKYVYGDFRFSNGQTAILTFWFAEKDGEMRLLGITPGKPE